MLTAKYEGKRLLERPRSSWEDDININNKEAGCHDVD
jgi:hypothetical protein